ncbi:MAG: fructose-bisphosphatase class III [Phycisphaerales bacterium]
MPHRLRPRPPALPARVSASYPDRFDALREAAGLSASLTLDAPTIHVISDIHGEDVKLRHVIHNASGALRPLVEHVLAEVPAKEREQFLAILYYPREALQRLTPQIIASGAEARTRWVFDTLTRQCAMIRALRRNYRRNHVTRLVTAEFRELLVEMLSAARPNTAARCSPHSRRTTATLAPCEPPAGSSARWLQRN